jgi:hypothetical protein
LKAKNTYGISSIKCLGKDACRVHVVRDLIREESLVVTRFTNALVRSRPLKENGAEQVSFDQ